MIRGALKAQAIETFLPDELLMQTVAWNLNTFGFVRIQVAREDLNAAQSALEKLGRRTPEAEERARQLSAEIPLSVAMKCLAFCLPLFCFAGLVVMAVMKSGYANGGLERKASESLQWFGYGMIFWIAVIVGLILKRT